MKTKLLIGCSAVVVALVVLLALLGPTLRRAAQRRTFGRGVQTIVELLMSTPDLYDDVAAAPGNMADGTLTLETDLTLEYAGPYVVELRTACAPDHPLPSSSTIPQPTVDVLIKPLVDGREVSQTIDTIDSPFYGVDGQAGFILYYFDAPGAIPLDEPVFVRVTISHIHESFAELYGPEATIAVMRSSSE